MAEQQQQEAMVKEVKIEKKAFMAKPYSRDEKIKKDEEELEKLKAEQKGEKDDSETGETKKDVDDTSEPKSAEERSFKKRYGDLRRHQQTQQKEFESKIEELTSQLDSATKKEIKLPKSEEELDAWAKEYPDVAAIVETIALKKAKEQSKDIENRMAKMEDMRQEATKEKAEVELLKIHPDFSEIRDQDEFHNWQKNNLSGFKMLYMKIVLMLDQRHEP